MPSASFLHLSLPSSSASAAAIGNSGVSATVGPVVLFSVLDHYLRRTENQERVIGALLGVRSEDGSEIEIRNCFPLSVNEVGDQQVVIDTDHLTQMYTLHQRVQSRETIVGWYATGQALNANSVWIHEFFANETSPHAPIHLLVDANLNPSQQQIVSAFASSPVGVPDSENMGSMFIRVPCNVKYSPAEKSSLDLMMTNGTTDAPLVSEIDSLEDTIERVLRMIEQVQSYVDAVVAGKEVGNKTLGRYLMDMVESVPVVKAKEFEQLFNGHLQDMLMVVYLANLTRTQLAIAERLHKMM
ncbi:JAB1/Mov34/MPN/PAD-1 ubiquitin protease-domain-containing protein [Fimicolochytrium jonesii]|uniref:JAB1/Mov34/MPN/PAD-1 ubiquitin protease-domain-containing protein n=1 Tax=Fimicolochytrium jonesii TaxID=1396493 RepID=UPI0022FEAC5C|nr:JAB1/Mov34/MPN/PAD-1 ubiquitin protease-domain-containing protein [Fimicolochytrium jonesii]KAI8827134.1 JAB1/Mov34/MPN/PAD-1 ubiquitin protease-domain-containing protein [Fimicolochytrium jonesii]